MTPFSKIWKIFQVKLHRLLTIVNSNNIFLFNPATPDTLISVDARWGIFGICSIVYLRFIVWISYLKIALTSGPSQFLCPCGIFGLLKGYLLFSLLWTTQKRYYDKIIHCSFSMFCIDWVASSPEIRGQPCLLFQNIYIYKFQILLRIRKYVKLKFQTNKTLNLRLKLLKN